MFVRNLNFCSSVCMSVARPVRPQSVRSLTWKVFSISQEMVWLRRPYRRSEAIPTHFLPAMQMTAAPLYCMMDDILPSPPAPAKLGKQPAQEELPVPPIAAEPPFL
jgi:hypothetical protein